MTVWLAILGPMLAELALVYGLKYSAVGARPNAQAFR